MKHIAIIFLLFTLSACGTQQANAPWQNSVVKQSGDRVPAEISTFIEQRQECDRLPNSSGQNNSRADALLQKQKKQCSGTEKELRRLKRKYAHDREAMKALYDFEDCLDYEAKCD